MFLYLNAMEDGKRTVYTGGKPVTGKQLALGKG
jgi:hypothetical protein